MILDSPFEPRFERPIRIPAERVDLRAIERVALVVPRSVRDELDEVFVRTHGVDHLLCDLEVGPFVDVDLESRHSTPLILLILTGSV